MPTPTDPRRGYENATKNFEDGIARICDLYGVSPLVGRLYVALFLSAEPVSLEDLAARVGAAKSTVSVALRKLLAARIVRRLPSGGDRRDYYEAVTDPWAALSDWIRIYFQPELDMWRDTSSRLEAALVSAKDAPKGHENAEILRRIRELDAFSGVVADLLRVLERDRRPPEKARAIPIIRKGAR
jgi:DNA-binding transcriptional regulator GbsR (MarR family)